MHTRNIEPAGGNLRANENSLGMQDLSNTSIERTGLQLELSGYVNAGGRGTRLASVVSSHDQRGVSKALLAVGSPPRILVDYQIDRMQAAGIDRVIVGVGDHLNVVEHVQRRAAIQAGVFVTAYEAQLGNGGDLVRSLRDCGNRFAEHIAVSNVDTILDVDLLSMYELHRDTDADATIALTRLTGVPNQGAFYVDDGDQVVFNAELGRDNDAPSEDSFAYRASSTGALILRRELLEGVSWKPAGGSLSLYGDIMGLAMDEGSVTAYDNGTNFFMDVGTVDTWFRIISDPEMINPYLQTA